MKKILIGTHNKGKFREIAYLLSKKYKKVSPISLKIPSPKETCKSFSGNSKLKVNFSWLSFFTTSINKGMAFFNSDIRLPGRKVNKDLLIKKPNNISLKLQEIL